MLKGEKYNVIHFIEYSELKDFLKEFPENNLLIVDYHLQEHSGANYVRTLKSEGFDPYFIAISSSDNPDIKKEMKDLGAKAFFKKDDNFVRDLPSVINGLIELRKNL